MTACFQDSFDYDIAKVPTVVIGTYEPCIYPVFNSGLGESVDSCGDTGGHQDPGGSRLMILKPDGVRQKVWAKQSQY